MRKTEFSKSDAFKTLDTINMWIGNCDTKASIILASIGIVFTLLFDSKLFDVIKTALMAGINFNNTLGFLYSILVYSSLLSVLLGLVFFVITITPKIVLTQKSKKIIGNKVVTNEEEFNSFMFYGSIAQKTLSEYCQQIEAVTEDKIMKDLCFQINAAAAICNSKFNNLKRGVLCFGSGLVGVGLFVFIYYMVK